MGPRLEFVHEFRGISEVLQRYSGEKPEAAVQRMCSKHQFSENDCDTLRGSFFQLHGEIQDEPEQKPEGSLSRLEPAAVSWIPDSFFRMFQVGAMLLIVAAYRLQWGEELAEEARRRH